MCVFVSVTFLRFKIQATGGPSGGLYKGRLLRSHSPPPLPKGRQTGINSVNHEGAKGSFKGVSERWVRSVVKAIIH